MEMKYSKWPFQWPEGTATEAVKQTPISIVATSGRKIAC